MSETIKTLIVDDIELARERIKMFLKTNPEIEIIGECANGREAIAKIHKLSPDLVFLDIQMPKTSGFDVVQAIGVNNMPAVIFVTAYDEFAIRAFEVNAVDYLLKPFSKERLTNAVERAKRQIKREIQESDLEERLNSLLKQINSPGATKYLKRITVKNAAYIFLLPTEEIEWIKAAGNYVELHVGKEMHLIRESLTQLEERLDPERFVRIHRSRIVNINFIKSIYPLFSGDHIVVLRNGTELNMSRTYSKNLI